MPKEKVEFTTTTGHILRGTIEKPKEHILAYALFAHCFTGSKDNLASSRICRFLAKLNIATLRIDFTGLGTSEGDFSDTNFTSNIEDLTCAANFLSENYLAPELLIGHSLGGTAVLAAQAELDYVRACVTIGSPGEPEHVIKQFKGREDEIEKHGELEVMLGGRAFVIKKEFLEDVREYKLLDKIASSKKAFLIMHSPEDTVVSIEQAAMIYKALKHPKSFISLSGADHMLTQQKDANYVAETIQAWCKRYLELYIPDTK